MGPIIGQAAAEQPALATRIAETGLLAESLWINVALAGVTIIAIIALAREVRTPRAQLIIAATLFVPVVSLASPVGRRCSRCGVATSRGRSRHR
jgi:halorhodopsin